MLRFASSRHSLVSKALRLEPAKQRIKRAFVDLQPGVVEHLAQRVAIALLAERRENRQAKRAAAKLDFQLLEQVIVDRHCLCVISYVLHTI